MEDVPLSQEVVFCRFDDPQFRWRTYGLTEQELQPVSSEQHNSAKIEKDRSVGTLLKNQEGVRDSHATTNSLDESAGIFLFKGIPFR